MRNWLIKMLQSLLNRLKKQEIRLPVHHEMIPGIGWVPPGHPLHPDTPELLRKGE